MDVGSFYRGMMAMQSFYNINKLRHPAFEMTVRESLDHDSMKFSTLAVPRGWRFLVYVLRVHTPSWEENSLQNSPDNGLWIQFHHALLFSFLTD